MYKISVIIPTYNSEKFIEKTINSVINQSIGFENIELIIADDNSSDNTKNILKRFDSKYKNVKCIYYNDNSGGPSRGRNGALNLVSSEYVMFLDHDDCYDKFICEKLYSTITKYDVNITMCNYSFGDNNVNPYFDSIISEENNKFLLNPIKNKFMIKEIEVWNKIFKVSFLNEFNIKFPENVFAEDLVFSFKSFLNCDEMVFIKDYYGYIHDFRNSEGNYSTGTFRTFKHLIMLLNGFKIAYDVGNVNKRALNLLMDSHLNNLMFSFVMSDTTKEERMMFMEELYKFQEEYGWQLFSNPIANTINKNIKNRNFKRALYLANTLRVMRKSDILLKIYNKIF